MCRPTNRNVVSSKWLIVTKKDITPDGTLSPRLKAKLVARGFLQVEGVAFFEPCAPVVKFTLVRVIWALVAVRDMELHPIDVVTAFFMAILKKNTHVAAMWIRK